MHLTDVHFTGVPLQVLISYRVVLGWYVYLWACTPYLAGMRLFGGPVVSFT